MLLLFLKRVSWANKNMSILKTIIQNLYFSVSIFAWWNPVKNKWDILVVWVFIGSQLTVVRRLKISILIARVDEWNTRKFAHSKHDRKCVSRKLSYNLSLNKPLLSTVHFVRKSDSQFQIKNATQISNFDNSSITMAPICDAFLRLCTVFCSRRSQNVLALRYDHIDAVLDFCCYWFQFVSLNESVPSSSKCETCRYLFLAKALPATFLFSYWFGTLHGFTVAAMISCTKSVFNAFQVQGWA